MDQALFPWDEVPEKVPPSGQAAALTAGDCTAPVGEAWLDAERTDLEDVELWEAGRKDPSAASVVCSCPAGMAPGDVADRTGRVVGVWPELERTGPGAGLEVVLGVVQSPACPMAWESLGAECTGPGDASWVVAPGDQDSGVLPSCG